MTPHGLPVDNHWYLVSSHGSVLFYVALNPDCTIQQISEEMALTQRTIWGLVGDLRRASMLHVRREGRRHHYTVNLDAPFKHPVCQGLSLRTVMGPMIATCARTRRSREPEATFA
ncbi:MAG: hypothetical protein Q7T33_13260 [Dehalococcoidia bacterium]|nr:hypothetical protein [Dehalococcoidia bacterium]